MAFASVAVLGCVGGVAVTSQLLRDRSNSATQAPSGPSTPVQFELYVDEHGVTVTTEVHFDGEVILSHPQLHLGDAHEPAWLWPLDGTDHEGEDLEPLTVPDGISVEMTSTVRGSCNGDQVQRMRFGVSVREADGTTQVHEFTPRNEIAMPQAILEWCAMGPTVTAGMERLEPDGDAVIGIYVINPGPKAIEVTVPAYADGHVSWTEGTIEAPPGEKTRFEIYGTDVGCEPGEIASWAEGRLSVDGEPMLPPWTTRGASDVALNSLISLLRSGMIGRFDAHRRSGFSSR